MHPDAKVGILGIYRQDWAITRFVDRARAFLPAQQMIILAEEVSSDSLLQADDSAVVRCWRRSSPDYSKLAEVIAEQGISVLHINCCFPFFDRLEFLQFIASQRQSGLKVVCDLHDMNALDSMHTLLVEQSDAIIVDASSHRLQVIAAGVEPERVEVIASAVDSVHQRDKSSVRQSLGIPKDQLVLVGFDFGVPDSDDEDAITALYRLERSIRNVHLYLLQIDIGIGFSGAYGDTLRKKVERYFLDGFVHFIQGSAQRSIMSEYIAAADVTILSGSGPQFETREVLGACLEQGAPVVSSSRLPLDDLDRSVFYVARNYPLPKATELLLGSEALRGQLSSAGREWASRNDGLNAISALGAIYERIGAGSFEVAPAGSFESPPAGSFESPRAGSIDVVEEPLENVSASAAEPTTAVVSPSVEVLPASKSGASSRPLNILMMNRSNAFSHRGGDTVLMERVAEGLRALGHKVDIDVSGEKNPADYDLAHLHNFAIREATEKMARRCKDAGTPYVVTTMYEDWPKFFNQMANVFYVLKAYIDGGQPAEKWPELLDAARKVEPAKAWDNTWAAHNSEALIATGSYEAESLRRDYPDTPNIEVFHCGCEVSEFDDGGELFRRETGLDNFVFCVGRLEWRKNQLMLLKALEDSDLTVVFATGGFTYQPDYELACRSFVRKGKTIFLGRLEADMLASAFAAARVHVLPSWFELPGLVSLEAARYGTNVVITDYGNARDYFGDLAYYCAPDDDSSIAQAVTAAYYAPTKQGLVEHVKGFTWQKSAEQNVAVYRKILDKDSKAAEGMSISIDNAHAESVNARTAVERIPDVVAVEPIRNVDLEAAEAHCSKGDEAMHESDFEKARSHYQEAVLADHTLARAHRSLGVVELSLGNEAFAYSYFRSALRQDPRDTKSLLGLGSVSWQKGDKEEAFTLYQRAAENDPNGASVILHLVNSAYELDKMPELEKILRKIIRNNRDNIEIQYCLAGCYFKQEKFGLALGVVEHIIQLNPEYVQAEELKLAIEKKLNVEHVEPLTRDSNPAPLEPLTMDSTPAPLEPLTTAVPVPQEQLTTTAPTPLDRLAATPPSPLEPLAGDPTAIAQGSMSGMPIPPSANAKIAIPSFPDKEEDLGVESENAQVVRATAPDETIAQSREIGAISELLDQMEADKRQKKYDDVIVCATDIAQSNSASKRQIAHARILRAESMACSGDSAEADVEFSSLLSDSSFGYRAWAGRGAIAASLGQWAEAVPLFERSLELKAGYELALAGLGICAKGRGDNERAWEYFQQSLESNPECAQALHGIMQLGYELGRLPQMEEALRKYLELRPVDFAFVYSLAGCLYAQHRTQEAKEQCRKILLFEPEHTLALELMERLESESRESVVAGG
jgi:glycosyltransferase involved in cell wall biosynthesis/Tfp pilus assembly protein PilF